MSKMRLQQKSYFEVFRQDFEPWLKDIDLFIKCSEPPLSPIEAAKILRINTREILEIIGHEHLSIEDFFILMEQGSSDICRLYRREVKRRSPFTYTAADIAYIYSLNFHEVNLAFSELGIIEASAYNLPNIFMLIPAKAYCK